MPVMVVGALLLWKRQPWGFVLATIMMVKGATYPLALVVMSLSGTYDPLTPVYAFFFACCSIALGLLLWNMRVRADAISTIAQRRIRHAAEMRN